MLAGGDHRLAREGVGMKDPNLVIGLIAHVDAASGGMDRETGQEDGGIRGIGRGGNCAGDGSGGDRRSGRGRAVGVVEDMEEAGVAPRDEDAAAVAGEDKTVEGFLEREELGDLPRGEIVDRQAGIAEAAADGDEPFLSGKMAIFRAMSLMRVCVPAGVTPQPLDKGFAPGRRPARSRIARELRSAAGVREAAGGTANADEGSDVKPAKTRAADQSA